MKNLRARAEMVAISYLERAGMSMITTRYRTPFGIIPAVFMDEGTIVRVDVRATDGGPTSNTTAPPTVTTRKTHAKQMDFFIKNADLPEMPVRYDRVAITVITEDRALLRHVRDINDVLRRHPEDE